ncbi:MAG: hypothetical protein ACT4OT_14250 [Acidobacteriota bacterium]
MSSTTITTVITMLEGLPEHVQVRVVEHLREYLLDLQDEAEWNKQFENSQPGLISAARQAKQAIQEGLAKPLDFDQL